MSELAENADAVAAAEKIVEVLNRAGWTETERYRLRCTECDYSQQTGGIESARHFHGVVDSTGHGYVAETRVVLASPWVALDAVDPLTEATQA